MNHFEHKIDLLFERKKEQAATLKKRTEEQVEETQAELKHLPFNVSTVLNQISQEAYRRSKTLKSAFKTYEDYHDNDDTYDQ